MRQKYAADRGKRIRFSGTKEFESGIRSRRIYQLGVFEYSAQGQGRSVIAHDRDANARSIYVRNTLDRRPRRHQKGVIQLENGRRELDPGPRRVGPHEAHVTRAASQARHHLRNGRMPDRHDLGPDPGAECASNVEKNDPYRGSLRLTCLGILLIHNGVHPDADFAGLHEVSDSGVRDLLRLREVCQHGDERDGEKKLLHVRLQRFWLPSAMRCKMRNEACFSRTSDGATSPGRGSTTATWNA